MRLTRATPSHPVWSEVAPQLQPHEFRRPGNMAVEALRLFHRVRMRSGVPFRIVSDSRVASQNIGVSGSAHNEVPCTALDLRVHGSRERYLLVTAALAEGFTRVGIYPPTKDQLRFGANAGTVHLDMSPTLPQQVVWVAF